MANKFEDLTGQTFADLTAVHRIGGDGQGSLWEWQCVCGKTVSYAAAAVKKGHTLSCGCRRKRNAGQFAVKNCWDPGRSTLCSRCGVIKSHLEYRKQYRGKSRTAFPRAWCKVCDNSARKTSSQKTPERRLAWALRTIKIKSQQRNIPFGIVLDEFLPIPRVCPIFATPMNYDGNRDSVPTFDRLIPKLGYISGNVRLISHRANRIKSDATLEELKRMVAWWELALDNHPIIG